MNQIYNIKVRTIDGKIKDLKEYMENKVTIIVNVASSCKYTPQYEELQKLYDLFKNKGFTILAFPCNQFNNQEPMNDNDIKCLAENKYNVSFPILAKTNVKGPTSEALFKLLNSDDKQITWNFTKFLFDHKGNLIKKYNPDFRPLEMGYDINGLLDQINKPIPKPVTFSTPHPK